MRPSRSTRPRTAAAPILALCLSACAGMTVQLRESYRTPDETPLGEENIVALDTGETIDLGEILKKEGRRPAAVTVYKAHGVYVLVANGFHSLYFLFPKSGDKAAVEARVLEPGPEGAQDIKIRPGIASPCATLSYRAAGSDKKFYLGSGAKTSPVACPDGEGNL